jgi:serine phosphatase RsbU (regulator of sigma subunit)
MAGRRLRVTAEPVLDDDGTIRTVRGTVQDVTEERAREGRLRLAEEALAAQRRQLESDRKAAEALQRALLPTDPELGIAAGVEICGRCRATAKTGDVDGDWYDAMPLAGGAATALMLGDVADTGLSSMTTAARLRYAVRAYASLDMPPGDILTAINSMLWMMEVEHTATLVVARYEPATRQLRWAAAGQLAPIRYDADKHGSVLSGPLGLPLGAAPEVEYHEAVVTLAQGDRVLFYTDGLVKADGRRSGALDVLLRAGQESDLGDIEALVSHITGKLGARPEEDMCAMLVKVTR